MGSAIKEAKEFTEKCRILGSYPFGIKQIPNSFGAYQAAGGIPKTPKIAIVFSFFSFFFSALGSKTRKTIGFK